MNPVLPSKIKILVVDDEADMEPLILQKFWQQIREGFYDFIFSLNGQDALDKIGEFPEIGIILSDINMPEMDGLTLLAKLKELKNPGLKTIIVTAYGDMDNIRTAMNRGAFDFITKPVDFDDLEITINKTLDEIRLIHRALEEHDQLVSIRHDLRIARAIQQAILPKVFPPFPFQNRFDIYASMVPANEIGGDFFDFFRIDDDRLGIVVGDVSGKGIPAAILMAVCRTLILATGLKGASPDDCLSYVNSLLFSDNYSSMFVTVFYGILHAEKGEIEYVNAGHNAPYLLSGSGIQKLGKTDGIALGVLDKFSFHSSKLDISPGEKLFIYTNGITNSFNKEGTAYGTERLERFLNGHHSGPVETIIKESIADLHAFTKDAPQSDDITLLALVYHGRNGPVSN